MNSEIKGREGFVRLIHKYNTRTTGVTNSGQAEWMEPGPRGKGVESRGALRATKIFSENFFFGAGPSKKFTR